MTYLLILKNLNFRELQSSKHRKKDEGEMITDEKVERSEETSRSMKKIRIQETKP